MATRIIVVEDEPLVRVSIVRFLESEGYRVREAADVAACRAALRSETADIVIVDLGLPGADGVELVRELRAVSTIDVMVVTQRGEVEHRVATLDAGADDYLVKPIELVELAARLRVLERRRAPSDRLVFGGWIMDLGARTLFDAHGGSVALTRGEFDLLHELLRARGKIVSRERLSAAVARSHEGDVRSVDALVSRLRRKLAAAGEEVVATAPGFGYRLIPEVEADRGKRQPDP